MRFYKFCPEVPRKHRIPHVTRSLGQVHTWQPIKGHACQKSGIRGQVTNRIHLSLSCQLDQNHHKPRKPQEHNEQFLQTLTFQNQIQAQCSEIHHSSQRFITESSSSNHFPCNSSVNSPLEAANSNAITEEEEEKKKGKKFKESEPVKKEKRRITGQTPNSSQEISGTESNSKFPKISTQIPS